MHMIFTEQEKRYIDASVTGWRILPTCPPKIRKSINDKLKRIKEQEV